MKKRNKKACFIQNSDHWSTPSIIYDHFIKLGYIDPCPLHCDSDNLGKIYKNQRLFINPPFSQLSKWIDYVIQLYELDNEIMLLIPARTDTVYFHKLLKNTCCHIFFLKGRLKFNDGKTNAPFPSLLIYVSDKCIMPIFCKLELNEFGISL